MIGDLFSKLKEARQVIEETKKKLNDVLVEIEIENGAVKVTANANKVVHDIEISEEFFNKADKAALEDLLMTAINKALEEAAQKGEIELKEVTKGMLPNFPGLI